MSSTFARGGHGVGDFFVVEFTGPGRLAVVVLYQVLAAPSFLQPEVWLEPEQQGPLHLAQAVWCYPVSPSG